MTKPKMTEEERAALVLEAVDSLRNHLNSPNAQARPSKEHIAIVLDALAEFADDVSKASEGFHRVSVPPYMMRAKLRCISVIPSKGGLGETIGEVVKMVAVSRSDGYGTTGEDENNTFARWSPSASFEIYIANPALFGKITEGAEFYVDFSEVAPRIAGISADLGGN